MSENDSVRPDLLNGSPKIRFAKRSLLLMSSSVLRMFIQLAVIFFYARKLSIPDYGMYQSVWLCMNIVSVISLFGLPSLILSIPLNNISEWIRNNTTKFFLLGGVLNIVPLVFILLFINNFNLQTRFLLSLLIIVQNISIVIETITIKKEKEMLVFISNLFFIIAYFVLHFVLICTHYSLELLITGMIFIFLVKLLGQWYFIQNNLNNAVAVTIDPGLSRQWGYLGFYDVTGVISKWLDKWVILSFISVTQFAVYFNGSYEIPVFGLMVTAVGSIMIVEFSKPNIDVAANVKLLFQKSTSLLSSIVFPAFCFLLFYRVNFFRLIFSEKYDAAIPVFLISIFVLPLRITNTAAVLQVNNRNDLILKGAIIDLFFAFILMALLYPIWGLKGLALAFVISTYIQIGYYLWHTGKIIRKSILYFFPWKFLLLRMCVSLALTGAIYLLAGNFLYPLNLIAGIVLCLLLTAIFLYNYYKFSRQENNTAAF